MGVMPPHNQPVISSRWADEVNKKLDEISSRSNQAEQHASNANAAVVNSTQATAQVIQSVQVTQEDLNDKSRIPAAPVNLTVTPEGYIDQLGDAVPSVRVQFDAVSEDIEGNGLAIEYYEIWYREADILPEEYNFLARVFTADSLITQDLIEDVGYTFEVRAVSQYTVTGAFSDPTDTITVGVDTTPLSAPTAPTLTTKLGIVSVAWGGSLLSGKPPVNFRRVAVYYTAEESDYVDTGRFLITAGTVAIADLEIGSTYTFVLRAVDSSGNESTDSESAEITVIGVQGPDLEANSVTANAIEAGAIEVQHLSGTVGADLDISANGSINILAGATQQNSDDIDGTNANLDEMQTYYQFGPDGATVSAPDSPFALALRNDRIEMLENGNVVSYWNSGQMYVSSFVGNEVILGNHKLEKYETGTVVRAL